MIETFSTMSGLLEVRFDKEGYHSGIFIDSDSKVVFLWVGHENKTFYERFSDKEQLTELRDMLNALLYDVEPENLVPDTLTPIETPTLSTREATPTDSPQ